MITSAEWFNPTKVSGLVAYGTAVTCCAVAWMTTKPNRGSRLVVVTLIECLFLLDIAFSWRLHVHDFLEHIAQRHNEYAARRMPQVVLLCVLLGMLLLSLFAIWRLFRGRVGARLTMSGLLLSLALWWTEVISLHQVDHACYYRLGKIFSPLGDLMAIGAFWVLAALMTSAGILLEAKQSRPAARYQPAHRVKS